MIKLKGFITSSVLLDSFLGLLLITLVFFSVSYCKNLNSIENIRLHIMSMNTSACEELRKSPDDYKTYTRQDGLYTTSVVSVQQVSMAGESGGSKLVRLTLDTKFKDKFYPHTGLVMYINWYTQGLSLSEYTS